MNTREAISEVILDEQFYELLYSARDEALGPRQRDIFNARFGIGTEAEPYTLAQVGERLNLTRERIRQIQQQCTRRLQTKAAYQIRKQEFDKPSAQLVRYLEEIIQPNQLGDLDRIIALGTNENSSAYLQPHILRLVVDMLYTADKAREYNKTIKSSIRSFIRQQERQKALNRPHRISKLFDRVLWPTTKSVVPSEEISDLSAKRKVNDHSSSGLQTRFIPKSGQYFSLKNNRLIQYESDMERQFLEKLEKCPDVFRYQDQPFPVPYGNGRIYYPDVLVVLQDGYGFVVEIKRKFEMGFHSNLEKWRGLWRFCKDKGYGMLITNGWSEIMQIKNYPVRADYQSALFELLSRGPVTWQEYRKLKHIYNPHHDEFLSIILNNKLIWELDLFLLKKPDMAEGFETAITSQAKSDTHRNKVRLRRIEKATSEYTEYLDDYEANKRAYADAIKHGLLREYKYEYLLDIEDFDDINGVYFETICGDKDTEEFSWNDLAPEGMASEELDYDSLDYEGHE